MDYELNESFIVDNDNTADWALRKIRDEEKERDRLISIAEDQIRELNAEIGKLRDKCEDKTKFLKGHLALYFSTVPHKETKTQESYKLLNGSLVMKKPSIKIIHDDDKLLEYLDANDGAEYIKTKRSVDWVEFKKSLSVTEEGKVIDKDLGIIMEEDVCRSEEVPASFDVKLNKEEE